MKDAKQILSEILSERKASNPSYSLRAFARDIGLSTPQLSNVMNGHRGLSLRAAEKVSRKLMLDEGQKELFVASLRARFSSSHSEKAQAKAKLTELSSHLTERNLDLDLFKAISNWHHFALTELIKISKGRENSVAWFSKRLALPENETRLALARLERLGLVEKTAKGYLVKQDVISAEQPVPTEAVRKYHRQLLEKSIAALVFQDSSERYGYSAAMPVKVKSLDRAKKLIQKFRMDFAKEISDHEGGEEVYGLCLQFFRLTQKRENSNEI